jgi:uncharacterized membrane protein
MVNFTSASNYSAPAEFSIGVTLGKAFTIFWNHLGAFLLIAGAASIPNLISLWFQAPSLHNLSLHMTQAESMAVLEQSKDSSPIVNLLSMVGNIFSIFAQATIFITAFGFLTGSAKGITSAARAGISRFWPLVGLGILVALGVLLAAILLVVPGIILSIIWSVAFPACVVERLGPIRSLGRSAALTKGNRWKLFGLFLLIVFGAVVIALVAAGGLFAAGGGVAFGVGLYALQVIYLALAATISVTIYHDLRIAKEGIGTDRMGAVFE